MCFSPQRRAIFQHLNVKKCSEPLSFLAFSLQNVLLATAACNFWFLLWPHDSAPAALTSLLFDSPDTRIIWKTQHFATSLTFGAGVSSFFWLSRYCIVFLLTLLHLLTLLSCDFTSSICFSSAFQLSILSEVYYLNFLRQLKVHKNIQKLMMNNLLQFLFLCQVFGTALLSWQQCKILEDQPCFIGQSVIRPNAFKSHGQWCRQAQVRGEGINVNLSSFRSVGYGSKLLTWHFFGILISSHHQLMIV